MLADDPSLVDARDDLGRTPLHLAAIGERVEIVRLLIEAGAQIDSRDDRQRTPFRHAAWENSGVEVLALLPHGADVNAVGFLNQPPLEVALFNQNESVIDFVLDNGATLPAETAGQFRLMYLAAINSSTRVFDLMFDIVPTLDPAGEDAFAFLRGAAYGGSAAILGHLLATGIDLDSPDAYQVVPIHTTSRSGSKHMPFIAPDDSYMVLSARNRPGGTTDFSLYLSFRGSDGSFPGACPASGGDQRAGRPDLPGRDAGWQVPVLPGRDGGALGEYGLRRGSSRIAEVHSGLRKYAYTPS